MHRVVPPFLLLALVALVGCGGAQASVEVSASVGAPAPPPPVPMRAPETLLPAAAPVVVRVDLAALRNSPHFGAVHDGLRAVADGDDVTTMLSLADRTDEIWGAVVPGQNRPMAMVIVARGRYTPEDARQIVAAANPPATPGQRGAFTIYTHGEAAFSLIGDHTIVIGVRSAVEGALDLQASGDGTGPTDSAVLSGMERIGFRQAGAAVSARITEEIYAELELPPILQSSIESASAAVAIDDGVHGAVIVRTSSSFVAGTLIALGRTQLAEARREPQIEALGLAPLLNGITLASEGPEATARLEVSGPDVAALVSSLSAMFGGSPAR